MERGNEQVRFLRDRRDVPLRARLFWLGLPERLSPLIEIPFPGTRGLLAGGAKVPFREAPDAFLGSYCIMNLAA
jgi:hypothetical protein